MSRKKTNVHRSQSPFTSFMGRLFSLLLAQAPRRLRSGPPKLRNPLTQRSGLAESPSLSERKQPPGHERIHKLAAQWP
jgi:hypothetical protein